MKNLHREVFTTSRALEYFTEKELTAQTGHGRDRWSEVILKELTDNGLDACEGANILPQITVTLTDECVTVEDNGSGLPASVIESVLDYTVRASSKDAYISPTRGAQGNALKTVLAIPYVLSDATFGKVEIASRNVLHQITIAIDRIAQSPVINCETSNGFVKNGTSVRVFLSSASAEVRASRFYKMLSAYSLFNPHASFVFNHEGESYAFERTAERCGKWLASEPTSQHWYTPEQLRLLIAAYINLERESGKARTVREFISEFRGLSGTAKQKTILGKLNVGGSYLRDFVKEQDIDRAAVENLLEAMKAESKPIKPASLGIIGEAHFRAWFERQEVSLNSFKYIKTADVDESTGLPFVVEIAFAARDDDGSLQLLPGVNWSPALTDPFRLLNSYGLGLNGLLNSLHVGHDDAVTLALHLACPHLNYTDRGKSSLGELS
jgi:DNA topoisomerase VI subunit B